jgi:hypothetical protein
MGWFADSDPAQLVAPDNWDRIGDLIEDEFFAHRPLTAQQAMA